MARRALKGINWAAIAERIPESERTNFIAFKSRSEQYQRRVSDLPEAPAKLDWATYKNAIPIPGLVDKFQKEFESLKVPYPADNYTSKIDVLEKEVHDAILQFIQESNKRIDEFKAESTRLKNLLPFDQMTMEDFAEAYPEQALNIDKPTIWPHIEEVQPDDRDVPTPMPKADH